MLQLAYFKFERALKTENLFTYREKKGNASDVIYPPKPMFWLYCLFSMGSVITVNI